MTTADFGDIGACVFDAYGTLLDFNSAVNRSRDRLGGKADALADLWRRKQLEYTWLRSLMNRYVDFWQVTIDALEYSLAAVGIDDAPLRDDLMALYREIAPYPEAAATLQTLKDSGMPTAILSNGSPDMLASAVRGAGLDDLLDDIISVHPAGIYKPHPSVYQLAVDGLGIEAGRICFQSANAWDIAGAASFGFRPVWINRAGQPPERLPDGPVATLDNLAGLPALLGL
ncbi:MAG: haloacid dehalogenase type II [Alphaproteobacteria bacterium]